MNPIISKNGDGKNSLFVIQGTIIFPHSRLSSHSKKKFPHSRLRRSWGNFFSLFLLSLSWENIIVPFMTHREFLFPLRGGEAASRGNTNSLWVMKGTIIFPHERLSRSSEEKFPHERRSREWGNFFSLRLLSLEWGNIIVPWMTNREFFPSPFFKMIGLTFLLC